ncbi:MAG: 30S ribosomal protein S2 [Bacteroidia bacterium]|nr:30S ribosomal protein S2 [Bacteroidia bacterium]
MPRTNFKELLDAGVHFGHLKRKWNPAMAPYIFMERNGIHIIDLEKTIIKLDEAASAMKHIAKSGKKILFVATKKQAKEIVAEKVNKVNMPYVTERWPGGMLQVTRQRAKLEKNLGSIIDLTRLPSALFIVDVCKEHIAVREAKRLGIPVFAMVDTNSDPTEIDFPIPANDDASKSISLIIEILCQSIEEGLNERKIEKDKEPQSRDRNVIRKELETKDIPESLIKAIVEEEEEEEEAEDEVVADEHVDIASPAEETESEA